ncbi:MAG TPA: RNA-binding protein [Bacteroidota bacterium]|nr:RNA-binding protein [Bacteroidota bacterium]
MIIFTGNLSAAVTESDLRREFRVFGEVSYANLVMDRVGKVSRGFGYLSMPVQSEAMNAIQALHGKELKGSALIVKEARPRALNEPDTGDTAR